MNAVNDGQLNLPSGNSGLVYLDVEQGTSLSADYWAGWANTVYEYDVNGTLPFIPGVYAYYVASGGKYSLNNSVQQALNTACKNYPNKSVVCYGLWPNEPEPCSDCDPDATPDTSVFNFLPNNYAVLPIQCLLNCISMQRERDVLIHAVFQILPGDKNWILIPLFLEQKI